MFSCMVVPVVPRQPYDKRKQPYVHSYILIAYNFIVGMSKSVPENRKYNLNDVSSITNKQDTLSAR